MTTNAELPDLTFPRIMLMVTDPLVPAAQGTQEGPMSWAVSGPHPFIEGAQVIAMFTSGDGIDVYSVRHTQDGAVGEGMRDHVGMRHVRVFREAMPLDIFFKELTAAELEDEVEEDDDEGDGDDAPAQEEQQPRAAALAPPPQTEPQAPAAPDPPVAASAASDAS